MRQAQDLRLRLLLRSPRLVVARLRLVLRRRVADLRLVLRLPVQALQRAAVQVVRLVLRPILTWPTAAQAAGLGR